MKENGSKFDKSKAKEIYKTSSAVHKAIIDSDPWIKVIDDAVDKCNFPNTTTNLRKNIDEFYNCTNTYLLTNCVAIEPKYECDTALDALNKCNQIMPNCLEWPLEIMLPEFCCKYPELISNTVQTDCHRQCVGKATQREGAKCFFACLDEKLNLKPNGKYDFNAVKTALNANAKPGNWEKVIEKAVESCKLVVQGINFSII